MGFGGQMHNGSWLKLRENPTDERMVANIAVNKCMSGRGRQVSEVVSIASVGK